MNLIFLSDMKRIESLVRPNIRAMVPYSTARDEFKGVAEVFMDANESPFDNGYNRYPDPSQARLKRRIAEIKGVDVQNIFVGNGSDEAIDLCFRIFCNPGLDNAIAIAPSYGMYSTCAAVNDVEMREVLLNDDFSLPVERLLDAADNNSKLLFICSPNNPTGNVFPREEIERILQEFDGMVVLDEAYIDFADEPGMLRSLENWPNLIILQTLSKAWGMAGLRAGLAFASNYVMRLFAQVKYPYNINVATLSAVEKLLKAGVDDRVKLIKEQRAFMEQKLSGMECVWRVYPSQANFLLVQVDNAADLYNYLLGEGIIVRDRSRMPLCDNTLRITIGTPQENVRLLRAIAEYDIKRYGSRAEGGPLAEVGPLAEGELVAERELLQEYESRSARVIRTTNETSVSVSVDLDNSGTGGISTGLSFLDHMLMQLVHHGGIMLTINASGDLEVDEHHTMEDVAITLGQALSKALGDKRGIERYGFALPMDESEAIVLLDFGGRIDFKWEVTFYGERVGDVPTQMFRHFFQSLCSAMNCNLHISARGENDHHIAEAIFKAFARALKAAVRREPFNYEIPSSKGLL